jgi:hypothetical protein
MVEFWPSLGPYDQPDLLLHLRDETGTEVHTVLIEAKYLSPKSSFAGEYEVVEDETPHGDQLVKYWQGLRAQSRGVPHSLLYLTAGSTPPLTELQETLRYLPSMRLGWLSWRDVWAVASDLSGKHLPAADLARLLQHKGLTYFTGFSVAPRAFPAESFWEALPAPSIWFDRPLPARVLRDRGALGRTFWEHL